MSEPGSRRGRAHDAEGAREAILNAAEEVFAEHGFDGARIDAIAATAGYNKSLIFQYFDDKLGLYAEVVRRADREINEVQAGVITALSEDETIASNAHKFRTLLETSIIAFFDYLVEHPRIRRILIWEVAEGWQTYAKIMSQRDREDVEQFRPFFSKLQSSGLLRSGIDPIVQLVMAVYICPYFLASIPLYQMILPGEDFSSAAALARAREYIVDFLVSGMMVDPPGTKL
jgi:TetR/AcrR family transcriptional regulator